MTPQEHTSPVLRRAALALHALQADDRRWILDALPAGHGGALRTLLQELQDLGIVAQDPSTGELLDSEGHGSRADVARFDARTAARLAELLRKEPHCIAVAWLAACPPGLRGQFLASMNAASASPQQLPVAGAKLAPALQAAVSRAVRRRISLLVADEESSDARTLWMRVAARWRKGASP